MQVYETNLGVVASVIKALAPHFGAYALYNTDDVDILIIATRGTALPAPDDRLLESPQLRAELARVGVQSVADIQTRKIGDNLTIGPLLQTMTVPPNSDFFPYRGSQCSALALPAGDRDWTSGAHRLADSVLGIARRRRAAVCHSRACREQRAVSGSSGATGARDSPCRVERKPRQFGSAQRDLPVANRHESRGVRRGLGPECLEECGTKHQR